MIVIFIAVVAAYVGLCALSAGGATITLYPRRSHCS